MYRVLVVDDSPTARQLLVQILSGDPDLDVVGVAKDGRQAIELASQLQPDVITMDLHLPDLDGFQATKEIMIQAPTRIVIVSANAMAREVDAAVRAMRAGALTMLLKPPGPASPDFDQQAKELVATVKAMAEVKVVRHLYRPRPKEVPALMPPARSDAIRAVAIAASTGGPPALQKLLAGLPPDFPVPILLVQHIASHFTAGFAAWLNSVAPLTVKVAAAGEPLMPATVYIAPEQRHLAVSRGGTSVMLSDEPPIGGFRPSATYLFSSVARGFGRSALGMILTGMGCDGVEGLRSLRAAGGTVFAQDEATSVVFGMPGMAVAEGLADRVLPLDAMAEAMRTLVTRKPNSAGGNNRTTSGS
jgi:two-component system chemotaxis response regulator CheB